MLSSSPSVTPLRSARNRACREASRSADHRGADGAVRCLVDEDEAADGAVAAVLVAEKRQRSAQPDPPDIVEVQPVGVGLGGAA